MMPMTLVSGLFFPHAAAAVTFVYIAARELYGRGYRAKGPGGRMYGSAVSGIAVLTLLGMSVYGCVSQLILRDPAFLSLLARVGLKA